MDEAEAKTLRDSMLNDPDLDDIKNKIHIVSLVKINDDNSLSFTIPAGTEDAEVLKMAEFVANFNRLLPYIVDELEKPQYKHLRVIDVMCNMDADCRPILDVAGTNTEQTANIIKEANRAINKLMRPAFITPPKQHTIVNSTLMQYMQQYELIDGKKHNITLNKNTNEQVFTLIDYDAQGSKLKNLTEHERQVTDAFASLWNASQEQGIPCVFDEATIYAMMPGNGKKISEKQAKEIRAILYKFNTIRIGLDYSKELQDAGLIEAGESIKTKPHYLDFDIIEYKNQKGYKKEAYYITKEPPIITDCKRYNEFATLPAKYFAIKDTVKDPAGNITLSNKPDALRMSSQRQDIAGYLLRRISIMRKDLEKAKELYRKNESKRQKDNTIPFKPVAAFKKKSSIIKLDTLFSTVDIEHSDGKALQDDRDFILKVLDYEIYAGLIKGYSIQRSGQSHKITSINIALE